LVFFPILKWFMMVALKLGVGLNRLLLVTCSNMLHSSSADVIQWHSDWFAAVWCILGVFVTREHVRHNKSGIAHRGRTGINH
jgi:hypothetical protein